MIVERLHDGSRTTDVSFEISGPPVYRVRTVKNERIYENVIDANSGSVSQPETASSLKELDREDLANIAALRWIKQDLSDAVRVAEKAPAGNALTGGLMKHHGKLNFVVVVASGEPFEGSDARTTQGPTPGVTASIALNALLRPSDRTEHWLCCLKD